MMVHVFRLGYGAFMKTRSSNSYIVTADASHATSDLNALVVHRGLATGLRANALLDVVARRLDQSMVLHKHFWRFDHLHAPMNREHAAAEAALMDIILLSVEGTAELPETVRDWMTRSLEHLEDRVYAIGVLLDGWFKGPEVDHPVIGSVQDFARQTGSAFFCGSLETIVADAVSALKLEQRQPIVAPYEESFSAKRSDLFCGS